jgi:uncharacterized membrane protein YoaK (UPF0700 family)
VPTMLRDAWHTLVPRRESPHGPLPPVLVVLTVVAGLVDAFSYLALGHVFVANMTGNVVFIALALAGEPGFSLTASGLSLVAFVVGGIAAGRLGRLTGPHRGRQLLALTGVQSVLLVAAFAAAARLDQPFAGTAGYLLIGVTALGMGMQGGLVQRLRVPDLNTLVMTTTITSMAAGGWLGGGSDGRVGRRLVSVLSLAVGALIGGLIVRYATPALTLLLAALLLAAVAGTAVALARSRRPWTTPRAPGG